MADEKFVQLLTLELEFVLAVLLDRVLIGYSVILSCQKRFERHHRRLDNVRFAVCGNSWRPDSGPTPTPTPSAVPSLVSRSTVVKLAATTTAVSVVGIVSVFPINFYRNFLRLLCDRNKEI